MQRDHAHIVRPSGDREGGVEHVGADNMAFGRDYIADWFADTLGGKTKA